jgi:hypothetical protein
MGWLLNLRIRLRNIFFSASYQYEGKDYLPHVTEKDVSRIIHRDFPEKDPKIIWSILRKYESDSFRVYADILKLSHGAIELLKEYTVVAQTDFRDVISYAEYPKQQKNGLLSSNNDEAKKTREEDWNDYQEWFSKE